MLRPAGQIGNLGNFRKRSCHRLSVAHSFLGASVYACQRPPAGAKVAPSVEHGCCAKRSAARTTARRRCRFCAAKGENSSPRKGFGGLGGCANRRGRRNAYQRASRRATAQFPLLTGDVPPPPRIISLPPPRCVIRIWPARPGAIFSPPYRARASSDSPAAGAVPSIWLPRAARRSPLPPGRRISP